MNTNNETNIHPKKRSVRFHMPVHEKTTPPTKTILTQDEIDHLWYSESEINVFKEAARRISVHYSLNKHQRAVEESRLRRWKQFIFIYKQHIKKLEKEEASIPQHDEMLLSLLSWEDFHPRGLEQRISFERQMHKVLARQTLLMLQNRIQEVNKQSQQGEVSPSSPSDIVALKIAQVSAKLTVFARKNAYITGRSDYMMAYPEFVSLSSPPSSQQTVISSERKKRKLETVLPSVVLPRVVSTDEKERSNGDNSNLREERRKNNSRSVRRKLLRSNHGHQCNRQDASFGHTVPSSFVGKMFH